MTQTPPPPDPTPADRARAAIREALDQMGRQELLACLLAVDERLTEIEVAEVLGLTVESYRSCRARAVGEVRLAVARALDH